MANPRKLTKSLIPHALFREIEPLGHKLEAMLVSARYGFPARKMHVIGVTGTNGKTTTTYMIHKLLTEAGYNVAFMTTVAYGVKDDITPQVAHMTSVSAPVLQKRLLEFKKRGVEWVILETTSHALAQHRVWGVPYEIAVMTNITHEHLDYHGTFERYVAAKRSMFEITAKHGKKFGIVNADDDQAQAFTSAVPRSVTYGVKSGDLRAENVQLLPNCVEYTAIIGDERYEIRANIPGEFNVYNSLAVVAVGRELGLTREQIETGIAALGGVEGRMDVIDEGQDFTVINDFAHTPDSFEKLLSNLAKSKKNRLIVVFGSAGRRDESKRAIQGEIAGRYGDEVVITEEDDRDIDGMGILEQIAEGAEKSGKIRDENLFLVHDRTEAIHFAIGRAQTNDIVILLGKGHEKTIERADGEHPWDEAQTARDALNKR